jgi:hypothetical protein
MLTSAKTDQAQGGTLCSRHNPSLLFDIACSEGNHVVGDTDLVQFMLQQLKPPIPCVLCDVTSAVAEFMVRGS